MFYKKAVLKNLVEFPGKHLQKNLMFVMFSGDIEREQCHEMPKPLPDFYMIGTSVMKELTSLIYRVNRYSFNTSRIALAH